MFWALLAFPAPGMRASVPSTTSVHTAQSAQRDGTRSPHGPLTIPCENCHTSAGWKPIRAVPEFDHNKTKYPLRGLHEKVQCTQCHIKPVFTDVGKNCADCHADIHRRQMGSDCAQCHTVNGWEKSTQQVKDHQNRFPLFGAHAAVPCEGCHKQAATGQFLGLSTQCDSCHLQDWKSTTNPPHASAGTAFASGNCQGCHSFDSWLGAKFDHSTTGFLLTAGHANVACALCHINNNYNLQILPSACGTSGCHLTTWQQTNNPPHPTAGPAFGAANCANCHTTAGWTTATFDHSTTGFLLTNGHANVACAACHINNNYNLQIAPTNCGNSGCHLTTWQQTNNPVHSTSGATFAAANCANCHTTVSWTTASFDHSTTGFALTGAHTTTACALCHVNNNYTLTAANTDCYGCHQAAWTSTQTLGGSVPNHVTAGFPTAQCATCHNTTAWSGATFDHSTTGFPLTNSHQMAPAGKVTACAQCHINNNYALNIQPNDCGNSGCHLTTWQQTNNPTHSTSGAPFAAANCATCHNTIAWTTAAFDHSTTGFALVGTHMSPTPTPCIACHVNNNYTLTSADCMTCHTPDWNKTQTIGGNVPNHVTAGFPSTASACSTCHTITTWANGVFDHSATGFLLTNGHANVQCALCHINGNYNLTIQPTDCGNAGCHLTTWQQTNNPVHSTSGAAFGAANCSKCHTTQGWDAASFDHSTTGFALTGTHMSPTPTPCAACHINNNYTLSSADCMTCHTPDWNKTQTLGGNVPNHVASNFPTSAGACSSCHTITVWADGKFDHSTTGFPLANSHQLAPAGKVASCASCHINGNYTLTIQPNDCGNSGCHLSTWQTTNNPTHATSGPTFAAANCSTCHNTITWTTATFDHSTTGFPLTGSHQLAPAGKVNACTDCHVNNNYTLTAANTDCYGCHQAAWTSTQTLGGNVPNHVTAGFPTSQCATCHNTTTWLNATFDHSTTGFPLTNSHQMAPAGKVTACAQCHINNNYALTIHPTDCGNSGCHLSTWQTTNNPTHPSAGAPFAAANCSTCHNTITWTTATFDHSTTGWPLVGSHQLAPAGKVVACTDCHVNNNYTFTAANTDCYGCHQTAWLSTQTLGGNVPNHITAGFPTSQCSTCHDMISWLDGKFDHSTTGFPLTNSHQMAPAGKVTACAQCHINNNYALTIQPTDCGNSGCHLSTWQTTNNPTHPSAGAPFAAANCSTCHNTITWTTAVFDHSVTGWPLTGSHQLAPAGKVVACTDCHVNNNYTFTSANTDCYGCHQAAWTSTQTLGGSVPNHVSAGFPTSQCSTCHNTTTWATSTFNHANTGFTLTGAHLTTACALCHVNGNYALTSANTTCIGCHLTDWNSTQTLGGNVPNHVTTGFPQAQCATCHDTVAWVDGKFDHSTTGWALTGAHLTTACALCHVNSNYTLTSANTACYGCHLADWNSTQTLGGSVPNHVSAGYPTTCDTCHTTTAWTGATFNHTWFPVPHHGSVCADCHQVSTDYTNFTCIACHTQSGAHAQTQTDNTHKGVGGYVYGPETCYACHKNGGGG
jgi:hypothetical protein